MNAKRLRSILLISSLLLIFPGGGAFAQGAGPYFQGDPFLRGRNLCGVGTMPSGYVPEGAYRASSASLYTTTEQGDFRPGYSSSEIWRFGAEARTDGFYGPKGKTFLTGSFGFEQMQGKDMMTSMFINPGYYPIDVLEFTPGDKLLQTYRFGGGIARSLTDRWRVGGRMDFTSQNYAKRKDIRHTNYALDLAVSPSVLYTGDVLRLGLSGVFRKTSESIEAEQVGAATAETYMAFFDKGLRYGTLQAWDGSGIHLAEAGVNRLPVREFSYGAAAQLAWNTVYLDGEYLRTSGSVGEKGFDWYRFPGHWVAANAVWKNRVCRFSFHLGWMSQALEESVLDKVNTGGVTLPTVYGWNLVSRRRQLDLVPTLVLSFGRPALRSLTFGYVSVIKDEQASPSYPYTDSWHAALHRVHGTVALGLPFGGAWERFGLTLGARALWGSDRSQGLEPVIPGEVEEYATPATEPTRLLSDWVRKREYMLATALELSSSVSYRFAAVPGLAVSADAAWLHAARIEYLPGNNRLTATLRLSYNF